jgi:hypothetical protein
MGNVSYVFGRSADARLRPYVAGGAGVIRVRLADVLDAFSAESTLAAGNAGGGVLASMSRRVAIFGDARYFRSTYGDRSAAVFDDAFVSFWRVSGGAWITF